MDRMKDLSLFVVSLRMRIYCYTRSMIDTFCELCTLEPEPRTAN